MSDPNAPDDSKAQVEVLFDTADEEVKRVVGEVLRIERDNLHMSRPRVLDDIVQTIRRVVE